MDQLEVNNLSAEGTFADPLGRVSLVGRVTDHARQHRVAILRLRQSQQVFRSFGKQHSSRRVHSGRAPIRAGLGFTFNYTYGKSIDDASDSSPDVRVLTTGSTLGQVYYGAPRSGDRAISSFDIKHNIVRLSLGSAVWKQTRLFSNAPKVVERNNWWMDHVGRGALSGRTTVHALHHRHQQARRRQSLGSPEHRSGVPLKNPLYSNNCSIGAGCEPYINPAAFMRPPKGSLGNSPRTLDIRAPMQQFFDVSIQKSFNLPFIGDEEDARSTSGST